MTTSGVARARTVLRKVLKAVTGLVILLLGYAGIFALRASFLDYPLVAGEMTQLKGAYHVHTTVSDGRATPEHIARIAAATGLSFVILTDHNTETITPPKREGGVLLIYGTELSTPAGHLVALGLKSPLVKSARELDAVKTVVDQGAIAILAHPIQKKRPWTDWEAAKLATGFELYSADSMFRDAQRSPFSVFLPAMGSYLSTPMQAFMIVADRQQDAAEKLLSISSARNPLIAPCAADAHGLPPYVHEFKALSLVLPAGTTLEADPQLAQDTVLRLLQTSQTYCAFHGLAPADGFTLSATQTVNAGERILVTLPATLPDSARVEVFGQGKLLEDGKTVEATGQGALQIEVWVDVPGRLFGTMRKPWIVANPIRVLPAAP